MRVALTFHWAADLHADHRTEFLDFCLTLEEAATAFWLNPAPHTCLLHGPTLVFQTDRVWDEVLFDIEAENYSISEFHAVSVS